MNTTTLHKDFKLNDRSFKNEIELLDFTKNNVPDVSVFLKVWFDTNDFIAVNTSGSTGKPKSIQLKKEFMRNSALATGKYFNLTQKTTALLCLSPGYIAGKMMLVRALVLGWHLDVVEAKSTPLENVEKEYDFSAMVPMQVQHSLSELYRIKKLIVGGGSVDNNLLKKLQSHTTEIFATYGMTETITHIAVKRLNGLKFQVSDSGFYKVLPNVTIFKDQRGCLVIDAPKISDDKIITNDLVEIISDTEFKWLGRVDNVINSGGVKLIPEQIEEKLSQIISHRFFVSSIPDSILGNRLILLMESKPYEMNTEKIQSNLKKYEIPKNVYFLDQFVETLSKKVDRNKTKLLVKES